MTLEYKTGNMANLTHLSLIEARVLGALLEKEITTPEQYPLTLNALTLACNQKSNREPVMTLSESVVQQAVDSLGKKHLVVQRSGQSSRGDKFQQRFCNTEFSDCRLTPRERGVLCLLLLRGPQTAGEMRTRSNRLCEFKDIEEVGAALKGLINHPRGPFVVKLAREAGRRESRYAHLMCGEVDMTEVAGEPVNAADNTRILRLEEQVQQLLEELAEIKNKLDL